MRKARKEIKYLPGVVHLVQEEGSAVEDGRVGRPDDTLSVVRHALEARERLGDLQGPLPRLFFKKKKKKNEIR